MTQPCHSLREKLLAAIEQSDASRREKRADRIIWMADHSHRPALIAGTPEALGVLGEAEDAFREGHFISVILLALASVEHQLVDELVRQKLADYGAPLSRVIALAKQHCILDASLVERIDQLRLVRNPFAHLKKPDHGYLFGNRYIASGTHPRTLLEADAKEAFQVMYEVFLALLRAK